MEIYTIFALAVGLAMDAVAVSITAGAARRKLNAAYVLGTAFVFAAFQGVMPVLGWLVGTAFHSVIATVDHWIAFSLLGLIGGRMIYHDLRAHGEESENPKEGHGFSALLTLALATSVDAAVAGVSLIVLSSIMAPAIIIGLVTFLLCAAALILGNRFKGLAGKRVNTIGGLILIVIGFKILFEHLSA